MHLNTSFLLLTKNIPEILTFLFSSTDISKYPVISKIIDGTHFVFHVPSLITKTAGISKKIFWNQKIFFEISVVGMNFDFEISKVDCFYSKFLI